MSVITISRQIGSLGREIGRVVSERLGYRLVWRELINKAALRSGAPEAALAAIDELGLLGICPSPSECRDYREAVQQVIEEIAAKGNVVIVGRAGQVLLAGHPEVLHVRIIAPVIIRAERISWLRGISISSAIAQVEASDRYRANYVRRFYKVNWNDPSLYDLVLNTAHFSVTPAANLISQALAAHQTLVQDHATH